MQRAGGRDRLSLPAEGRAGGEWPGEQPPLAQLRTVAECPPGSAPPSVCT